MPRHVIRTPEAPASPFFSQAVRAGGLVFVAGQAPLDPVTGEVVGTTIQEQTRRSLTNIGTILAVAGSGLDRIVQATVIFAEEADLPGLNEEWSRWFPSDPPARQAAALPIRRGGMRISVAVIAEA
jgi:2-iminobutanoate/2-iminopropanoate deaminase